MAMLPESEIRAEVKRHALIVGALLLLTIGAVGLASLNLPTFVTIPAILSVATVQAVLIAAALMHLTRERVILWAVVILTLVNVGGLLLLPTLGHFDRAKF